MTQERDRRPVGVVLAGGGARGAYQLGALSVLLPHLAGRDEPPRVYVGTSIGALQVAYFARRATEPLDDVLREGLQLWQSLGLGNVVSPPLSPRQVKLGLQYLAGAIGLPLRPPTSFLAAGPIKGTVHKLGPFHQIRTNVENGDLLAAAVVATASATGRSVVFHDGGDPTRSMAPAISPRRSLPILSTTICRHWRPSTGSFRRPATAWAMTRSRTSSSRRRVVARSERWRGRSSVSTTPSCAAWARATSGCWVACWTPAGAPSTVSC